MIFDGFFTQLIPILAGRREGGVFTQVTGYSPRTGRQLAASAEGQTTLLKAARERARASMVKQGLSWDQATERLAQIPSFAGASVVASPFADLAALSPSKPGGVCYARTLAAGRKLDALNDHLTAARAAGAAEAGRRVIEEAGFASPEWFAEANENPEAGAEPVAWRAFLGAGTWDEMAAPLRILTGRALLDWFACWDVDFCLSYFEGHEPQPVFPLVAPRPSSRIEADPEPGKGRRGLFETPNKRLLDATATMLRKIRSRQWPEATPKLTDLAAWTGEDAGWLAKVGSGERPLPFARFEQLWETAAADDPLARPRGGVFPAPFPLYVAAQAFELMLVRRRAGARSARASTIITLGAELYQRPWERRLAAARASGAAIGVKPWPKALA